MCWQPTNVNASGHQKAMSPPQQYNFVESTTVQSTPIPISPKASHTCDIVHPAQHSHSALHNEIWSKPEAAESSFGRKSLSLDYWCDADQCKYVQPLLHIRLLPYPNKSVEWVNLEPDHGSRVLSDFYSQIFHQLQTRTSRPCRRRFLLEGFQRRNFCFPDLQRLMAMWNPKRSSDPWHCSARPSKRWELYCYMGWPWICCASKPRLRRFAW